MRRSWVFGLLLALATTFAAGGCGLAQAITQFQLPFQPIAPVVSHSPVSPGGALTPGAPGAAAQPPRLSAVGPAEDGWARLPDAVSDAGYEVLGGELVVNACFNGQPVQRFSVSLYGPTLATRSAEGGTLSLERLTADAGYRMEVRAPGCATFVVEPLAVQAKMKATLEIPLLGGTTLRGRVLTGGRPVEGAVVSDGLNSDLTDAEGRYVLAGVALDATMLSACKAGFAPARQAPVAGGDFSLERAPSALYWDASQAVDAAALRRAVEGAGLTWTDAPGPADTWLLPTPSRPFAAERLASLHRFVAGGGTLVLWGEWGASDRFDPGVANALLHRLGAHCNPDLIRNAAQSERLQALEANVGKERFTLNMYGSASVFALPPGQVLARAGTPSYRVMDAAEAPVLALGKACGRGKVLVLGDTSAWEGEHLAEAANAACLKALLRY